MTTVKTKVAEITVEEDGILFMTFNETNIEVSLDDAKEIISVRKGLPMTNGKQLIIVDLTSNPNSSLDAKNHGKSEEFAEITTAMALLVDGYMSKFIGNFFLGFDKPNYHVKLFSDKASAKKWLLGFK